MRRRKFGEGGVTDDDLEAANASEDPIRTLNKRKGWTSTEDDDSGAPPVAAPSPRAAPKERIVSKKELADSGLSLRDFLNKERGLTRRGESAAPAKAAPKAEAKPAASAPARKMTREEAIEAIPRDKNKVEGGERVDSTELGRRASNVLNALPGASIVTAPARAAKAAQSASRALAAAETPVTFLGKSGRRAMGSAEELSGPGAKALAEPTKRLTGPSKADLVARDRAARSEERNTEMLRENARRSGLNPDKLNPNVVKRYRDELGGSEWSLGMKRGGKVAPKKYASGGSVSKASSRADGIATKGKTRGRMV